MLFLITSVEFVFIKCRKRERHVQLIYRIFQIDKLGSRQSVCPFVHLYYLHICTYTFAFHLENGGGGVTVNKKSHDTTCDLKQ